MTRMYQHNLIIAIFLTYSCQYIDSALFEMKRSIVNGQGAAMFFSKTSSVCTMYKGLNRRQRKICNKDVLLMGSVVEGAKLAQKECMKQFKNERWDCSSISTSSVLGLMSKYATREAAFNYALVTASVIHVMARNCMKGDLLTCHCSRAKRPQTLNPKYSWGGCGDNIQYAADFTKSFMYEPVLNSLNGSTDAKAAAKILMDQHNIEVGKQAILKNRKIICKCHGATNHCATKTCWYQVQEFNIIGKYLKAKYTSAERATVVKTQNGKSFKLNVNNQDISTPTNRLNRLLFVENSPAYCQQSWQNYYSLDGATRRCNATISGSGSCNDLCCGGNYKIKRRLVSKNCRCKFHWCCEVRCEQCTEMIDVHVCSG